MYTFEKKIHQVFFIARSYNKMEVFETRREWRGI